MSAPNTAGWARIALGEVAEVNPRRTDRAVGDSDPVTFVPMAAVEPMSGILHATQTRTWGECRKGYTPFQDGDVLFARITPCMENGKVAVARALRNSVGAGSTEFLVTRPSRALDADFLSYFLRQSTFRRAARARMTGTAGQLRVPPHFLAESEIPLPPLAEQQRIVKALETHFTRLDAAVATLERVRANLRRYRAAVLQAAFEGRLGDENGAAHWAHVELAEIADVKGRLAKGKKRKAHERVRAVPYLRVANVQRGRLDLSEMKTIEATEGEIAQLRLRDGDVLFNEGGDRDKLGRGWIWREQIRECIHQNHVFRARITRPGVDPRYISWYGNSVAQGYFLRKGKQTTNLASISLGVLKRLPVPLPPPGEQQRIVERVEDALCLCDAADQTVAVTERRVAASRQSILRTAFEGRLVPQNPNDDPADVLLARIRAERAAGPSATPRRGRPRSPRNPA